MSVKLQDDDHEWEFIGIRPGETVTLKPATDPKPRQIVIMYRHAGEGENGQQWEGGRFVRFEPFDDDDKEPGIVIEEEEADDEGNRERKFLLTTWTPLTVTEIKPPSHPHAEHVSEIRQQLTELDYKPENEDCRYRLEKQIYDLEHEPADEWAGFDLVNA
jgi:hypothetical protein